MSWRRLQDVLNTKKMFFAREPIFVSNKSTDVSDK